MVVFLVVVLALLVIVLVLLVLILLTVVFFATVLIGYNTGMGLPAVFWSQVQRVRVWCLNSIPSATP
jgi:hypothetical protein